MHELLIHLEENEWQRIQEIAKRLNCPVEEVARRAISRLTLYAAPASEEWKQQSDQVLASVHERMQRFDPEEIEADITAAYREHRSDAGSG
ncbi:MAG: hypothetical protein NZ520_00955 [bacterium]|nr:hypothetical protein [bacterium]